MKIPTCLECKGYALNLHSLYTPKAWLNAKNNITPPVNMREITIPKKLQPIVKAFYAESPEVAKSLILQASRAIYGVDSKEDFFSYGSKQEITQDELEAVCELMQGLKPQDMLEALFASQIIVSHMLGMRKLAKIGPKDQHMGLKLLRFSNEALKQLLRKRSGGMQNITVNYNYSGTDPKHMPTIIQQKEIDYADKRS